MDYTVALVGKDARAGARAKLVTELKRAKEEWWYDDTVEYIRNDRPIQAWVEENDLWTLQVQPDYILDTTPYSREVGELRRGFLLFCHAASDLPVEIRVIVWQKLCPAVYTLFQRIPGMQVCIRSGALAGVDKIHQSDNPVHTWTVVKQMTHNCFRSYGLDCCEPGFYELVSNCVATGAVQLIG